MDDLIFSPSAFDSALAACQTEDDFLSLLFKIQSVPTSAPEKDARAGWVLWMLDRDAEAAAHFNRHPECLLAMAYLKRFKASGLKSLDECKAHLAGFEFSNSVPDSLIEA